jgi:hypothetical protein
VATLSPAAAVSGHGARSGVVGGSGDSEVLRQRGPGARGRGVAGGTGTPSGQQPHCPAAGAEKDRGGPAVAARMPGDTAPPTQGLGVREPRCLEAASVRVILRPRISTGAKSLAGTMVVPRSSSRGPWVGLALTWLVRQRRAGGLAARLAGWGLGFLFGQGLPPTLPPSIPGQGGGPWCWPRRTSDVPVGRRV